VFYCCLTFTNIETYCLNNKSQNFRSRRPTYATDRPKRYKIYSKHAPKIPLCHRCHSVGWDSHSLIIIIICNWRKTIIYHSCRHKTHLTAWKAASLLSRFLGARYSKKSAFHSVNSRIAGFGCELFSCLVSASCKNIKEPPNELRACTQNNS